MSRFCQSLFCLTAMMAIACSTRAQTPPAPNVKTTIVFQAITPPPPPVSQSPVAYFRKLLAMSPEERLASLTNRPTATRVAILAKVQEYERLGPDERELRLRVTELRWYLMPLLQTAPTNRTEQLARVPDDLRDLVKNRLVQWDLLPPPLKQEFLQNDRTLHYFVRLEPTSSTAAAQRAKKISDQFNQFFELTASEKEETFSTLSTEERAQMQKTLQTFNQLPPQQRTQCIQNYAKFADMSAAERADFLKNAERWSQMSPNERQTWRDLVANVPVWPPMPPSFPQNIMPPMPPIPPPGNTAIKMATN
jgi:hypothetical protein